MIQVDTRLLSRGILRPSPKGGVTIVTPLDELTDEDREDLKEFAGFVLSQHAQTPRPKQQLQAPSKKGRSRKAVRRKR